MRSWALVLEFLANTHWAAGSQAIGTLLGGAGFLAAAITAAVGLRGYRSSERNRNAEIAAELLKRWQSPELYEARCLVNSFARRDDLKAAYLEAVGERNSREFHIFEQELAFFEEVGVMWRLRGVRFEWIQSSIGTIIRTRWYQWQPAIVESRLIYRQPTAYENFQRLAEELEARR